MNKHVLSGLCTLSIIIILGLNSCGNLNGGAGTNRIAFDSVKVDTVVALSSDSLTPKCTLKLSIKYATGAHAEQINHALMLSGILNNDYYKVDSTQNVSVPDAVKLLVNKTISGYKKDYNEIYKQDRSSMSLNYELDITTKVRKGREGVENYLADIYVYTGGAHGQSVSILRNIDVKTGELLTKEKVFAAHSENAINTLIVKGLAKHYGVRGLKELQDSTSVFAFMEPYVPNDFLLEKDSVRFVYSTDEIACHAAGPQEVAVSYKDLGKLLKK